MSKEFLSQVDYIFFCYGLAFLLLVVACFRLTRHQPRPQLPWFWLGLFALIQGAHPWFLSSHRDRAGVAMGLVGLLMTLAGTALVGFLYNRRAALSRREEEARRLSQEILIIAEIGQIIGSTINTDDVYERFAKEVQKLIPFDGIAINIINQAEASVTVPYVWGMAAPGCQPGDVFPLSGSATGEVARSRSGMIIQTEDKRELQTRFPTLLSALAGGLRSRPLPEDFGH